MQTFFKMRRNSTFKTLIGLFSIFALFAFYIFMTDIFVLFPPMLGILFLFFCSFWVDEKYYKFFLVLACLFWIELDKNLIFGGLFAYFFALYILFYVPFSYFFAKTAWMKVVQIAVVYLGFGVLYFVFLSSGYVDFWNLLFLLLFFILLEGIMVLTYEFKN